jgi:hypothetical protein
MGLARSGAADEDDIALMDQELSACEIAHERFVDRGTVEVELGDVLGERQLGDGHLVFDGARLLLGDLGGQQVTDDALGFMLTLHGGGDDLVERALHAEELELEHGGELLSDIAAVDVYQLHREPQDWRWREDRLPIEYLVKGSSLPGKTVALKLALSATITDDRIVAVLGDETPVWSLTTPSPHNDVMHRAGDLADFRAGMRGILDRIKATHGEDAVIHISGFVPRIRIGGKHAVTTREAAYV